MDKLCSKCGQSKPVSEFNARKQSKDGLRTSCKSCDRVTRQVYEGKIPAPAPVPDAKVIGRIEPPTGVPQGARITVVEQEVTSEDKKLAAQFSTILNRKLGVRQRANLLVKIARNIQGGNAALALQALRDINLATGVTSKTGVTVDVAPLFAMPADTKMKMG